jgi:cyanophycin synthetase
MRIVESHRLTGPGLLLDEPGAAVEVAFDPGEDRAAALAAWTQRTHEAMDFLELHGAIAIRQSRDGASLALSGPIDTLHTTVELAEHAVTATLVPEQLEDLAVRLHDEASPPLLALQAFALQHDLPFLWDDDEVSLGFGPRVQVWPAYALPDPKTLDPQAFRSVVPIVCVTGTNGKTTTARLLSRMVAEGGRVAGTTSTDGLEIGGHRFEPGDWTGPGGARRILRDPRVEVAVLEVARGGFLRRGVPVTRADVAIVTNVSDDHLGEWGIDTVAAMAEAKLVVRKTLHSYGLLVLPATSVPLVEAVHRLRLREHGVRLAWQAIDSHHPGLQEARRLDEPIAYIDAGWLCWERHGVVDRVVPVADVPLTFAGKAVHNVENALAALLAAWPVLPRVAIEQGLRHFQPSVADNPGRANVFAWQDRTLLVDFAHNPDGVRHLAGLVADVPARRRLLLTGQAGDRSDDLMRELVRAGLQCRPDRVLVKESLHYLRGRLPGEVPALLRKLLIEEGFAPDAIEVHEDELHAIESALAWSEPGDLLILLIHDDFQAVVDRLLEHGAVAGTLPQSPT